MAVISCAEAMSEAFRMAMRKDQSTFIVGEGVAVRGGCFAQTRGLLAEFGADRVLDMPISEAAFTGMCAGAAACGSRAVVDIMYMDFTLVAMDQIINQAAKLRCMSGGQFTMPLTIVGLCGADRSGGAHHSGSLHPLFMNVPSIKIVIPSNAYDTKGLLVSAVLDDSLTVVCVHRGLLNHKSEVPESDYRLPLGEAVVIREGKDITIVAAGMLLHRAVEAADELAERNIHAEVIDPRTLAPLDEETIIESVKKTGRLVVADEGYANCGVGAEIIARVQEKAFDYLDAPMQRVHTLPTTIPFSPTLEQYVIPQTNTIVEVAMTII